MGVTGRDGTDVRSRRRRPRWSASNTPPRSGRPSANRLPSCRVSPPRRSSRSDQPSPARDGVEILWGRRGRRLQCCFVWLRVRPARPLSVVIKVPRPTPFLFRRTRVWFCLWEVPYIVTTRWPPLPPGRPEPHGSRTATGSDGSPLQSSDTCLRVQTDVSVMLAAPVTPQGCRAGISAACPHHDAGLSPAPLFALRVCQAFHTYSSYSSFMNDPARGLQPDCQRPRTLILSCASVTGTACALTFPNFGRRYP